MSFFCYKLSNLCTFLFIFGQFYEENHHCKNICQIKTKHQKIIFSISNDSYWIHLSMSNTHFVLVLSISSGQEGAIVFCTLYKRIRPFKLTYILFHIVSTYSVVFMFRILLLGLIVYMDMNMNAVHVLIFTVCLYFYRQLKPTLNLQCMFCFINDSFNTRV